MRKVAVALLTTSLITSAAFAADNNQQPSQGQQTQQQSQDRTQQNSRQPSNTQNNQQAAAPQNDQQAAQNNQSVSPRVLSRVKIRRVQQALNNDGFSPGRTDGRWGPRTENAVKQFQQSKQIQPNGQLDQQTVADLGLNSSSFAQPQGGQR